MNEFIEQLKQENISLQGNINSLQTTVAESKLQIKFLERKIKQNESLIKEANFKTARPVALPTQTFQPDESINEVFPPDAQIEPTPSV
jgi:chromosome segregation ATPase